AVVTAVFAAYSHIGTPAGFIVGLRPALGLAAGLASLGAVTALAAGSRHAPARIHIEAPVATSEQADDAFSPAWECCVGPRRSLRRPSHSGRSIPPPRLPHRRQLPRLAGQTPPHGGEGGPSAAPRPARRVRPRHRQPSRSGRSRTRPLPHAPPARCWRPST